MTDPSNDPIAEYFEAIERVPRLSPDEQNGLVKVVRVGGDDALAAKHKLIETSLYLVPRTAHRFEGQGIAFPDLVQEGNLGIIRAIETIDPEERSFSWFAAECIENAITEVLQGH